MTVQPLRLKNIIEAALLAAGRPLNIDELMALFSDEERPDRTQVRKALDTLQAEFAERGITLKEVASGFRIQVKPELANWISRLWEERPARYSRALLETLSLIAYRQPITRGEIESVRGVTVNTHIMRTLLERGWIRIVGRRDVPGHPEMFGTTREFLDYFSLKSLDELPTLAELKDIDSLNVELDFEDEGMPRQVVNDDGNGTIGNDDTFPADADDGILRTQDATER
ncbi:MAG: SMC-Scp complex subunit ScpB [Gammaproteobacteria bacterium]